MKALSDQQIADLKAGRGMGLALAAELNGYPGPMHVLELATPLGAERRPAREGGGVVRRHEAGSGAARRTADRCRDRARPAIRRQDDHASSLGEATRDIASLQGELRLAHLKYHLATLELLTPEQAARYSSLRGYGGGQHAPGHHR